MDGRHLEMEDLLALRDGEGSARARSHVGSCELCRGELDRLHRVRAELRALPTYRPARDLWPRVADRVRGRRRRRARVALGMVGLAAAVLAAVVLLRGPIGSAEEGVTEGDAWVAEMTSEDLGPVIVRSRELESLLETYRPSTRVYDAPTALAVSVLEDRMALLDRMLAEGRAEGANRSVIRGLWGERVQTLEKLVGLQLMTEEESWQPSVRSPETGAVWR